MKLRALTSAIVAAGAVMANSAFALAPTATIDLHIYMAGASAEDKALQTMATRLCDTASLDVYSDIGVTRPEGSAYSAFSCTMTTAKVPGLSGNLNVMIHKRSKGGSAWGVGPVAAGATVPQMAINTAVCGAAAQGNATINGISTPVWKCDANTTVDTNVVNAGVSDVEPALFNATSNLIPTGAPYDAQAGDAGTFPTPDSQLAGLTITGMSAVTFGVPVTKNLRDALQLAQGKSVGSDALADMPSLSKTQIASLFNGSIGTWDKFKVFDSGTGTYVGLNQLSGLGVGSNPPVPAGPRVNVCRRVPGSGTQAQVNALFLGDGCTEGAVAAVRDNSFLSQLSGGTGVTSQVGGGSGVLVHENNGSGDVDSCLNNLQGGNYWAVGLQSLEKGSDNYRYVAIDGVAPTIENVLSNKYWDWAANSIQWRTASTTGNMLTILTKIATEIANPTDLVTLNSSFNPRITGANVGIMALNTNGFAGSIPVSASNPVMTATRNGPSGTGAPNTCRQAVVLQNTDNQL